MQVPHCDICGEVITKTVYVVSILKSSYKEDNASNFEKMTATEFISKLQKQKKTVKTKEVCPECIKVWQHFIKLRLKELKKIKKTIEETFKLPSKKPTKKIAVKKTVKKIKKGKK